MTKYAEKMKVKNIDMGMEIMYYLGKGKTLKEISNIVKASITEVEQHIERFNNRVKNF